MAFQAITQDVQFSDLKGILSQSRAVDPALYQTVQILLERLDQFKVGQDSVVNNINNSVNTILQTTIVTPNILATYITLADETAQLPVSVQLLAGTGVTFDDSVLNKRTINATGSTDLEYSGDYVPATYNDGDIVVGADGIAYMCVKDGTTTPPESWPGGSGAPPAPYLDLLEGTYANPATDVARIYALDVNGYTQVEMKDSLGRGVRFASDNVIIAKVTEPTGIVRGQAVYIAGAVGANALVRLAKSNVIATMPAIGIVLDVAANNAFTRILTAGTLQGVNTSAFIEGVSLFVSPTVAGGFTDTLPTFPNYAQRVGFVTRSHATQGEILVLTTGVSADPRLHHTSHETGGSDVITSIDGGIITSGTVADARLSSNVVLENITNTFTANQEITKVNPFVLTIDTFQAADNKKFRLANSAQNFYIQALNDAETISSGYIAVGRTGFLTVSDSIYVGGGGVNFPPTQIPSANPNVLDDYEEGTFTPTDATGSGLVFASTIGKYTKIGNMVYFSLQCVYPTTSGFTTGKISLPFVNAGGSTTYGGFPTFHQIAGQPGTVYIIFNGEAAVTPYNIDIPAAHNFNSLSNATIVMAGMYQVL